MTAVRAEKVWAVVSDEHITPTADLMKLVEKWRAWGSK